MARVDANLGVAWEAGLFEAGTEFRLSSSFFPLLLPAHYVHTMGTPPVPAWRPPRLRGIRDIAGGGPKAERTNGVGV